jgi:hypothetical protein
VIPAGECAKLTDRAWGRSAGAPDRRLGRASGRHP